MDEPGFVPSRNFLEQMLGIALPWFALPNQAQPSPVAAVRCKTNIVFCSSGSQAYVVSRVSPLTD